MLRLFEFPLISEIGRMAFPCQMPLGNTSQMALVAAVGRIDFRSKVRRWAICFFADYSRNKRRLPIGSTHDGVALPIAREWPEQTALPVVGQHCLHKVLHWLAVEGATCQRVAVTPPAVPMHPAKPTYSPDSCATAIIDAAWLSRFSRTTHRMTIPMNMMAGKGNLCHG